MRRITSSVGMSTSPPPSPLPPPPLPPPPTAFSLFRLPPIPPPPLLLYDYCRRDPRPAGKLIHHRAPCGGGGWRVGGSGWVKYRENELGREGGGRYKYGDGDYASPESRRFCGRTERNRPLENSSDGFVVTVVRTNP